MGSTGTKILLATIVVSFGLAFSETGIENQHAPLSKVTKNIPPDKSAEILASQKTLNEAAASDPVLPSDRPKISDAAKIVLENFSPTDRQTINAETLEKTAKKLGLVLSDKEKRNKFITTLGIQVTALIHSESSHGITRLIEESQLDTKGNPIRLQIRLAAKEALRREIEKNKASVDFITTHTLALPEVALYGVKGVLEQTQVLQTGSAKDKWKAATYLRQTFEGISKKGSNNNSAITELFSNKAFDNNAFGTIAKAYLSSSLGHNFQNVTSPAGNCLGVECARSFATVNSPSAERVSSPEEALQLFYQTGRLPLNFKSDGYVIPSISNSGIRHLAPILHLRENEHVTTAKMDYQLMNDLPHDVDFIDRTLSLKSQNNLEEYLSHPEAAAHNGAPLLVSSLREFQNKEGSQKRERFGHALSLFKSADGLILVRDPNYPDVGFDAHVGSDGKLSYSYALPNGKVLTEKWDNFMPLPYFWKPPKF